METVIVPNEGLVIMHRHATMSGSSANDMSFAGDSIPPKCAVIEEHVGELKQLFDAIDPWPFVTETWIPKPRNSSWVGPRTCLLMHRLRWW